MKFIVLILSLIGSYTMAGCSVQNRTDHGHHRGHNHNHGHGAPGAVGHDHGHGDAVDHDGLGPHDHEICNRPTRSVTHFTETTELFVEFPVLIEHQPSVFMAHLTQLEAYAAVDQGKLTIALTGDGIAEMFTAETPEQPGIFRIIVTPGPASKRTLTVRLETPELSASHRIGPVDIYANLDQANEQAAAHPDNHELIAFSKEQQWKSDFAIARVAEHELNPSIPAFGSLKARSDGEAIVAAPLAGRVITAGKSFPKIGDQVKEGQLLVRLAPRLEESADQASLELGVERARLALNHAKIEYDRLKPLFDQGAVAERRLIAAKNDVATSQAELSTARRRLEQLRRMSRSTRSGEKSGIQIRSPIAGTLNAVDVAPGTFINEGQELFHIADLDRLWLEARVSEANVGRLGQPTGAWFEVDGFEKPFRIPQGQLVAVGGLIDPRTRTTPVIFELENPQRRLRIGMAAKVHLHVGQPIKALSIPKSAILREGGQDLVMVQRGAEHFERRNIMLGARDAGQVQVTRGLELGEWVVVKGAYAVKLAGSASQIPAHGHAH